MLSSVQASRKVTSQEVEEAREQIAGSAKERGRTRTARNSEKADFIRADKVQLSRGDPLILATLALGKGIVSSHCSGHLVYFRRKIVEGDAFAAKRRNGLFPLLLPLRSGSSYQIGLLSLGHLFFVCGKKEFKQSREKGSSHFW